MRANTEAGESDAAMAGATADVPGYRPVSPWAVAALGLGILSGVALVSPVFLVVPLVAIAVAVAALRDVGREGVRKAGRLAALGGLALAAGFAGQALTAQLTVRSLTAARCAAAAEIFLAAIREGRIDDAVSMCAPEAGDAARKIEACGSVGRRCRAHPGDEPGTWIVRVVSADPVDCDVRLVLVPTPSMHRQAPVERWLVTACEVTSPAAVRPSAR